MFCATRRVRRWREPMISRRRSLCAVIAAALACACGGPGRSCGSPQVHADGDAGEGSSRGSPAAADASRGSPAAADASLAALPLRLVGRFAPSPAAAATDGGAGGLTFAWSGSTFEARFTGPSLAMRLRAARLEPHAVQVDGKVVMLDERTTAYRVRVDARAPFTLDVSADRERYELASGLDPTAPHEVSVTREAEAFAGVHELLGLELGPGGAFLPPRVRARRLEIVGDSITCGYGVLGADAKCPFTYATERATAAYGALLGQMLDADVTTVCWSGRGVARNFDGSRTGTMPDLFELTLPAPPAVRWPFAAPPPHVVIVNLGTNDFLGAGGEAPDLPSFEEAYARLVRRIEEVHHRPWIVVTTSPMLGALPTASGSGSVAEVARASLARVVERRVREGNDRIELVVLPNAAPRWGCDGHPDATMNTRIAEALAPTVRSRLPR
jgi:lysophospholipase L1-like esterase